MTRLAPAPPEPKTLVKFKPPVTQPTGFERGIRGIVRGVVRNKRGNEVAVALWGGPEDPCTVYVLRSAIKSVSEKEK